MTQLDVFRGLRDELRYWYAVDTVARWWFDFKIMMQQL